MAERLRALRSALTPAERKVARVLLADYPLAALEPVARLAAAAGVSGPTVIRFSAKLGFPSYAALQGALKAEVSARLSAPQELYPAGPAEDRVEDVAERAERLLTDAISASFAGVSPAEFAAALGLLADPRRRVLLLGGRYSSTLSHHLAVHLTLLRADVAEVSEATADRVTALLDVGRRHLVVAFDYRRYQRDTVRFGAQAKAQGAAVLLFTDTYLSPLAAQADVVLPSVVTGPSPFDALTPALALVEAVVAGLVERLGAEPRRRMARYDALNEQILSDPEPTRRDRP